MDDALLMRVLDVVYHVRFAGYPIHYPPMPAWEEGFSDADARRSWGSPLNGERDGRSLGLYAHIPFCQTRCKFCFLPVTVLREKEQIRRYMAAFETEVDLLAPLFRDREFSCGYIGGGTPSLMPVRDLERFLSVLTGRFRFARGAQISMEANPASLDGAKLRTIKAGGVRLLSLGVQSLDERVTRLSGREQTNREVRKVYETARKAGVEGINVDLLCGQGGQTDESFLADVREVASWRPDQVHLNLCTPVSGNFPIEKKLNYRRLQAEGFKILAEAGYREIDSDSVSLGPGRMNHQGYPGFHIESSLLGLGPGALSHVWGRLRYRNRLDLPGYAESLGRGRLPLWRGIRMNLRREMIGYLLYAFIEKDELNPEDFRRVFGRGPGSFFARALRQLAGQGVLRAEKGVFRPHDEGRFVFECCKALFEPAIVRRIAGNIKFNRSWCGVPV